MSYRVQPHLEKYQDTVAFTTITFHFSRSLRAELESMSVAVMPPMSRASTSSSSLSHVPISRQNTVSSNDGRNARQSKRYSTALYLSMSATKEKDLEIEDDLARGRVIEKMETTALMIEQHKSPNGTTKQKYRASRRRISCLRRMYDILTLE